MQNIVEFKCDWCGKRYGTQEECLKCEETHIEVRPIKIVDAWCVDEYNRKYASDIVVERKDGTLAWFTLFQTLTNAADIQRYHGRKSHKN